LWGEIGIWPEARRLLAAVQIWTSPLGGSTIVRVTKVVPNGIIVRLLSRVVHLYKWLMGGLGWIVKKNSRPNRKERIGEKEVRKRKREGRT